MTPEEAIQVADKALVAHNGKSLTDIQGMILQESLAGKGYENMVGYDFQHIKNEGSILWRLLSEALGEKVSKKSFKVALEKRLKSGGIVLKPPMLSNYNEKTWVGREALISDLLVKLQGQTRLVWITGMSGIGKTTLGECVASRVWESNRAFQWVYLEILEGDSLDFGSVAAKLLTEMKDADLDPQLRNNPEQIAQKLIQKLKSSAYWIQMDSLERLLNPDQPTEFVDAYWKTFFERCLTESDLGSRLVLTSQALPTVLGEFSDRYPNCWSQHQLQGLLEVDQQLEFFQRRGLSIAPANRAILTQIARTYEGHPLVLKVIAENIVRNFGKNVDRYWQAHRAEFEQVARELQGMRVDEMEYNEALDRRVRERIKESLTKLPTQALELLCRSSVFRRPVPKRFWLGMIGNCKPQEQKAAYRALDDRALIEKEGTEIRQHNLICAVAYDLLRENPSTWETAERQAADLWLNAYKPADDVPNLEKLRGYLEMFYHRNEVQDYIFLSEFLLSHLKEFDQLQQWSCYHEMVDIYNSKLLDKLEDETAVVCAVRLGQAYYFLGNYSQALECWNKSLILARKIGNTYWEGRSLGNLTIIYFYQSNYQQAIKINYQYLVLSRSIADRMGEANALGGLAVSNHMLGNYLQAITYYQQELFIRREINDRNWEPNALANLGESYVKLNDHLKAIDCYEDSIKISKEVGNRYVEARSLILLSRAYSYFKRYQESLEYCQYALKITREIGNIYEEASALHTLGLLMTKLDNFSEGKENLIAALTIYRKLGNRDDESEALLNLASIYRKLGSLPLALESCEQALIIASELAIPRLDECHQLKSEILQELR